ncbi:hypothetical protein [Virgibacillus sp. DJP39]|uniref:hypothetical protein n=1 Tax=Virgibacillus sp. DJP39 TaxID=3409790 RepID=UPI003BB5EA51
MKMYVEFIIVLAILLSGCAHNETVSIKGKIHSVNHNQNTIVIYAGDTLTEEQKQRIDYDENGKFFEAFLVHADKETVVKGDVNSFGDLKQNQKVTIEIQGDYKKKLVTIETLFENHEKLPAYETAKITVNPYSKKDIVEKMTVKEGHYGLYIYNPKYKDNKSYTIPRFIENFSFQSIHIIPSVSEVKDTDELLGLYTGSSTYIVTDDKGIVLKTKHVKELEKFLDTLEKKESN